MNVLKAILYLRPNAKCAIRNNDYSTLEWDIDQNEGLAAPTMEELREVKAEVEELEAVERSAKNAKTELLRYSEIIKAYEATGKPLPAELEQKKQAVYKKLIDEYETPKTKAERSGVKVKVKGGKE